MAEPLSAERPSTNVTRASFLEFVERCEEIDDELTEAQETVRSIRRRRKELRKTIAASGIVIDEFDRHMTDEKRSGEEREAADRAYRQYMAWRGKPIGYQTALDLALDTAADLAALGEHELSRVERAGFDAGKRGERSDRNSFTPGTEAFARWHSAWLRGQAEKVTDEIQPPATPKQRGRKAKTASLSSGPEDVPLSFGSETGVDRGAYRLPVIDIAVPENTTARAQGREDGLAGHRDHASRWAPGEPGHADYVLGWEAGQAERREHAMVVPA